MSEPIEDYAKRQAEEYGQYIANGPIYVNGALAYAEGHPVPASNVEAHGYLEDQQVRRVGEDAPQPEQAVTPQGQDIVVDPAAQNVQKTADTATTKKNEV